MLPVIEARLLDKDYRVTPNFRVLDALEDRITVRGFQQALASGETKFRDTAWILWCALRYGTDAERDSDVPSYDEVGNWVRQDANHYDGIMLASRILTAAVSPGRYEEVKKKMDESAQLYHQEKTRGGSSKSTIKEPLVSGDGPPATSGGQP